jgi:hypothetical protein
MRTLTLGTLAKPFLRRHWYTVGLLVAAAALCWVLLGNISRVQMILLLNFVVLILHQFEEYGWPGGGPWIVNEAVRESDRPDRYPLNQNNALVINVFAAYPFYLLPVFFPGTVWLGLAPILFGFGQFLMHGIFANIKLRWLYNPGLAAVVLGHIPLGIWYLSEVRISGWDWAFAVIYMIGFMVVGMLWLGYTVLIDKNSPYPFAPEEMARFNRDRRLARMGRSSQ